MPVDRRPFANFSPDHLESYDCVYCNRILLSDVNLLHVSAGYPNSERFHLHYADLIDFGSLCAILK